MNKIFWTLFFESKEHKKYSKEASEEIQGGPGAPVTPSNFLNESPYRFGPLVAPENWSKFVAVVQRGEPALLHAMLNFERACAQTVRELIRRRDAEINKYYIQFILAVAECFLFQVCFK